VLPQIVENTIVFFYDTFDIIYILHRPLPILLPSAMVPSENIVIPLTGVEKLMNYDTTVTFLPYFNGAFTTRGKYYSLLLGTFRKIYILHCLPSILPPSSIVHAEIYKYSNYGHIKITNHGATVAFLDYFNGASITTLLDYFINPIVVLLQ
jgi:hypothetical protein